MITEDYKNPYDEFYEWIDKTNEENEENEDNGFHCVKWSIDYGLKLNFDGGIVTISSRFYYDAYSLSRKWAGYVNIYVGDKMVHNEPILGNGRDDLRVNVDRYVKSVIEKVSKKMKEIDFNGIRESERRGE